MQKKSLFQFISIMSKKFSYFCSAWCQYMPTRRLKALEYTRFKADVGNNIKQQNLIFLLYPYLMYSSSQPVSRMKKLTTEIVQTGLITSLGLSNHAIQISIIIYFVMHILKWLISLLIRLKNFWPSMFLS